MNGGLWVLSFGFIVSVLGLVVRCGWSFRGGGLSVAGYLGVGYRARWLIIGGGVVVSVWVFAPGGGVIPAVLMLMGS